HDALPSLQPACGQWACEPVWPVAVRPGTVVVRLLFLAVITPALPVRVADALLVTAHPPALPRQVASVCERPGAPPTSPVVVTVQPRPAHWPITFDTDRLAGGFVTLPVRAIRAASAAIRRASRAVSAAWAASFFCFAVAPGAAAASRACAAACRACLAWAAVCAAVVRALARIVSPTAWPDTEYEVLWMVQALPVVLQVPVVSTWVPLAVGGPRAPTPPSALFGRVVLPPEVEGRPEHLPPPVHSSVAEAADQLDAPATVAAPELAAAPGAPTGGSTAFFPAGPRSPPSSCASPVWTEPVSALSVDGPACSAPRGEAAGPEEAPASVTPWQGPPHTPLQEAQLRSPLVVEVAASVPLAELVTLPLQVPGPSHDTAPPEAVAVDGPDVSRFLVGLPDSVCAAPAPE